MKELRFLVYDDLRKVIINNQWFTKARQTEWLNLREMFFKDKNVSNPYGIGVQQTFKDIFKLSEYINYFTDDSSIIDIHNAISRICVYIPMKEVETNDRE